MKRKLLIALMVIIATMCCAFSLSACGGGVNGKYYQLKSNGEIDKKTYFILKSGKWEDEDGESGDYKLNGNIITFYYTFFGETEELCSGTVTDGVLKIKIVGAEDIYVSENHRHNYGEWKTTREVTCTVDGVQIRTCSCGMKETQTIKAVGYHKGDWVITKEATCTENGSRYMECTACKQKITEDVDKISHNIDWNFDNENHWQECSICKEKFSEKENHKIDCTVCGYPIHFKKTANSYEVVGVIQGINEIVIPSIYNNLSVTAIDESAFKNCSSLTSVTIPDSVTYIGGEAFRGCIALTSVIIGNSVTSIDYSAFQDCSALTSITIPNSVTYIGRSAFQDCSALTSVTIPNGVTSIGREAFYGCSALKSITLPNSVTEIGKYAFSGCSSLTSITIPDSVTSIGRGAFRYCSSLTSITIPDSVTSIGDYAFYGCSSLTSITIPDSVTSIGDYAFYGCRALTSITIPDSVTSIGEYAFRGCITLTSVTIPDSVTSIEDYAFDNTAYYNDEDNWQDGVLYIGNHLIKAKNTVSGSYEIKQGTLTIASGAFYKCSGLTSITIPDSVTSIGRGAFYDCDNIETAKMPTLAIEYIPKTNLKTVVLSSGTAIYRYTFGYCSSLTSITIPNSVTYIDWEAFSGCSALTDINFNGTKAQWEALEKGVDWDKNTSKYTVHCTDGDLSKSES